MTMTKRKLQEYVFGLKTRETIIAKNEEEARAQLEELYGDGDPNEFELLNVTTFVEAK